MWDTTPEADQIIISVRHIKLFHQQWNFRHKMNDRWRDTDQQVRIHEANSRVYWAAAVMPENHEKK